MNVKLAQRRPEFAHYVQSSDRKIKAVTIQYLRRTNGDKRIKIIIYLCTMILLRNYSLVRHPLIVCIIKQGFIQALFLTSVFYKGLSFMDVGHNLNPTCVSTLTFAAGDLKVVFTTFVLIC